MAETDTNSLAAVMDILAITMLVDRIVHPAEPGEFEEQIHSLQLRTADGQILDDGYIDDWFDNEFPAFSEQFDRTDQTALVSRCLGQITDPFLQGVLYQSMMRLCQCDDEVHAREHELLQQTAEAWGLA